MLLTPLAIIATALPLIISLRVVRRGARPLRKVAGIFIASYGAALILIGVALARGAGRCEACVIDQPWQVDLMATMFLIALALAALLSIIWASLAAGEARRLADDDTFD